MDINTTDLKIKNPQAPDDDWTEVSYDTSATSVTLSIADGDSDKFDFSYNTTQKTAKFKGKTTISKSGISDFSMTLNITEDGTSSTKPVTGDVQMTLQQRAKDLVDFNIGSMEITGSVGYKNTVSTKISDDSQFDTSNTTNFESEFSSKWPSNDFKLKLKPGLKLSIDDLPFTDNASVDLDANLDMSYSYEYNTESYITVGTNLKDKIWANDPNEDSDFTVAPYVELSKTWNTPNSGLFNKIKGSIKFTVEDINGSDSFKDVTDGKIEFKFRFTN